MKISGLLIALVVIGLFTAVFAMYFSSIATNYDQSYDNASLAGYNQIAAINNQTQEIQGRVSNTTLPTNLFYVMGGFLKDGFAVIKLTFSSVGLYTSMADNGFQQAQLGEGTYIFKTALLAVALIIFLFIVISIFVGREI